MVLTKVTVTVITLVTLWALIIQTSAAHPVCCRRHMKESLKLKFESIKGYSVQTSTEMCPISAIIFHLKNGKQACTNPALDWVMDYVNRIRYKAQKVHQNAQSPVKKP